MSIEFRYGKTYDKGTTVEELMDAAGEAVRWMTDTVCAVKLMDDEHLRLLLDAVREEAERRGLDV